MARLMKHAGIWSTLVTLFLVSTDAWANMGGSELVALQQERRTLPGQGAAYCEGRQ